MSERERCETCRYWHKGVYMVTGLPVYTCRRQPPTPGAITMWPVTKHDDWCGEWAAKQPHWLEREP
jgi:hypothetical protein